MKGRKKPVRRPPPGRKSAVSSSDARLAEALAQQAATAEILRVISSSPNDVQPVFDAIVRNAVRLCDALISCVFRYDGERVHFVGHHNFPPAALAIYQRTYPLTLEKDRLLGRAILERRPVNVADVFAEFRSGIGQRELGNRSILAVPMLREGAAIGAIAVSRAEPGLFPDHQVALLETFAAQAVIAVENVRLFTEAQDKNRALTESLEQQTATAEILRVISSSPTSVQPVFDTIAERAARLCEATDAHIWQREADRLKVVASFGDMPLARRELAIGRLSVVGRAAADQRPVHVEDIAETFETEFPDSLGMAKLGYRTILAMPLLREREAIGVIMIRRREIRPFSSRQMALLQTFADQAVIAIENVRMFGELEVRNRDLTETLEQQTATGEILRVISGSPTDAHPVFVTIAQSARRLCGAEFCQVFRVADGQLHNVANDGQNAAGLAAIAAAFPRPVDHDTAAGRAVLTAAVAQIPDVQADPRYPAHVQAVARRIGFGSLVAVPILRDGAPIGAIAVGRAQAGEFPERQVELLKTFADQAVIAIENVRLFQELAVRNRDLTGALERQTATSEILRAISGSPTDIQPVFDIIGDRAEKLCDAVISVVSRFDGELVHLVSVNGVTSEGAEAIRTAFPMRLDDETVTARAVRTRAVVHVADVLADPTYKQKGVARASGYRGCLAVPMMREGQAFGVIFVARTEPGLFSDTQVELLKTFADQAVIAVQNVRLFQELEARNRDLTETLEQQTATGEILRVISSSPTDVQPVFDSIAASAKRLCEAEFCFVFRLDGQVLHFAAQHGLSPEGNAAMHTIWPAEVSRGSAAGRSILDRAIVHIPDVRTDPEYRQGSVAEVANFRSVLGVPMLRDGVPIGTMTVNRSQAGPFPDRQIELLKTFADQAVIAIENVRLFKELDARTQDLTRSVGELKALGEVSQAVSSTLDLDAVLATIVSHAVKLSGSYSGIIYEYEEASETFHVRATHQITPEYLEVLRAAPIRLGDGAIGTAAVIQKPVQVADIQDERQLVAQQSRAHLVREGLRSLLAMPLIRENRLLGGLVVLRREVGEFAPGVVATMQTFATQSVLAIQNARLFVEIQRQKQYSDVLVQSTPVAIATMDLQGTVVGWNPGAERLFGYTQAEAVGRPMEDLVATPESRAAVRANIEQTLAGEWIRDITRRARKDGTLVDVEISSVPVVVEGQRVGMIGIYHDITELLLARREAEAANEAKSAFLATMSHEIRTPMNAVIGMSGLLLNTGLNDEQREYAEIVRQSGDTLLTVINDILDFSKIEAGRMELETHPFDLRECVEGALDLVATRAAEKGLDLAYLLGEGTPAALVGDVTRLRQVLLNLLSNAVKFTERGEIVLSVSARRAERSGELHEVTFAVRDTGIGIPADRLGRLFQSFSQIDASTTRRYGGTGLGLAISQRLTELMGGRITVTSEQGVGSEFRFTIRAAAAADVPVPTRRDFTGIQPALQGKRVLVVDDNATNRRILTTHLETWGVRTRATESPRQALGWAEAGERFDLGILDMHMPEMDGVSLARALRGRPAGAALPLILFTSLGRREARAEEAGFVAYLNKPIKPSQLFDTLVSVLAEQPVHVPQRTQARSELDPEMARGHPLRILLAEDNVVNQKVATRLLGQLGYRADIAANGLEAVAAVERQPYDVVLMDVQMPELDGFEASREINRRWPRERRPRIVAMTANAMEGDRERCAAAGMDDYVAKPIRVEELVSALQRCKARADAPAAGPTSAAPPAPAAGTGEIIDRAVIDRLGESMGRDFAVELIDTFVADARDLLVALRSALAASDRDGFRRAAHTLKSTGESLGAFPLAALARELEAIGQAGRLHEVGDRVDRLADLYERVSTALGAIRRDFTP